MGKPSLSPGRLPGSPSGRTIPPRGPHGSTLSTHGPLDVPARVGFSDAPRENGGSPALPPAPNPPGIGSSENAGSSPPNPCNNGSVPPESPPASRHEGASPKGFLRSLVPSPSSTRPPAETDNQENGSIPMPRLYGFRENNTLPNPLRPIIMISRYSIINASRYTTVRTVAFPGTY